MKLNRFIKIKSLIKFFGFAIGIFAIYLSLKNIDYQTLKSSIKSMRVFWILPIILTNFLVVATKALRWQIILRPVKNVRFKSMFKILTIGFMTNNILPARLGEAARVQLLKKDASISRVTGTATIIADHLIEGVSFIILAVMLSIATEVPKWMRLGLTITIAITLVSYFAFTIYSGQRFSHSFLKKLQEGMRVLSHLKLTALAIIISLVSWGLQGFMIYMTQTAFGAHVPFWGILFVLLTINLAVALPSAPSHIGTFEYACILAYTYLGLDKNSGLLIGFMFHLLQVLPITLTGGLMILRSGIRLRKLPRPEAPYERHSQAQALPDKQ